jgi:LPS sulfotransferase NodH
MTTRFILISPARSGSTMIRATMAEHPQILMHGEVMGQNQVRSVMKAYLQEPIKTLGQEEFLNAMMLARRRDTRKFIADTLFKLGGKKRAVGFKLILDQAFSMHFSDAYLWLAEQNDIKIIWLIRKNHLACYASRLLVPKGRILVSAKDELPTQLTTEVDPDEFQQYIRNQEAAMKIMRERFIDHQSLDIVYEDIVKDPRAGYKKIFSFLGVDDDVEPHVATKKVNSTNLNEVISNLEVIRNHIVVRPFVD